MTALLDLNDVALSLWHGDDCHPSPGYVWLNDGRYDYGAAAQAVARRFPRDLSTRFWANLDLKPLTPALGKARHSADLVHGHLQQLLPVPGDALIVAAPAHLSREQLSLLLGILGSLNCQPVAIVDRAVAIASHCVTSTVLHIELQLHQAVLTPVQADGTELTAAEPLLVRDVGWLWLLDRVAERVAAQFIEQTRFDPQRRAESEQALYDAVPALLATLATNAETRLEIDGYSATVRADHLSAVGEQLGEKLRTPGAESSYPWLVDSTLTQIPGLETCTASCIEYSNGWQKALMEQMESLRQSPSDLHVRRSLTTQANPASQANSVDTGFSDTETLQQPDSQQPAPTHLLVEHHARRIVDGTAIYRDAVALVSASGVQLGGDIPAELRINDETASMGQLLVAGDTLRNDNGWELQLIRVED